MAVTARSSRFPGWTWRAIAPGGVLHLCPPRVLPHSLTACYRPVPADPAPTLGLATARLPEERCTACEERVG
jgi:hypothetical protein